MDVFLTIFISAILLGSTIGLALGIPAALRLKNAKVILRSIFGAIVGIILGILLAWTASHIQSNAMESNIHSGDRLMTGGLMWMLFVLPSIVSVTAIIVGELAIFWFERSQRRN